MSDRIKPEKNISSFKYPWDDLSPHLVSSAAGPYCIVGIDLLFEWQTPNQVSVSMDHAILFHLFLPASFKGLEITLILNDLSFKTDKYIFNGTIDCSCHLKILNFICVYQSCIIFVLHLLQKRSGELQKDCKMDFNICHLLSKYWSSRQQILSVNKYDIKIYSICSVNVTKDMLYRLPPLSNGFFPVVIYFFPKSLNLIMSSNIFHQYFFIKSVLR